MFVVTDNIIVINIKGSTDRIQNPKVSSVTPLNNFLLNTLKTKYITIMKI